MAFPPELGDVVLLHTSPVESRVEGDGSNVADETVALLWAGGDDDVVDCDAVDGDAVLVGNGGLVGQRIGFW